MTSVRIRPPQIYEDTKTYPIIVNRGNYNEIVELSGKQIRIMIADYQNFRQQIRPYFLGVDK